MGRNSTDIEMENVRIEKEAVDRVRAYVKETRQTIGGFISMVVNEKMNKIDRRKTAKK